MVKKKLFIFIIFLLLFVSGCESQLQEIVPSNRNNATDGLIKVEIYFTDNQTLVGYIKGLGIEEKGKVYVGGSSLNYLYDKDGNIIGSYNYQRVLYIKILDQEEDAKK